jgi:hypothetical protein
MFMGLRLCEVVKDDKALDVDAPAQQGVLRARHDDTLGERILCADARPQGSSESGRPKRALF